MSDKENSVSFEALLPRQPRRLARLRVSPQVLLDLLKMPDEGVIVGSRKITAAGHAWDRIPKTARIHSSGVTSSGEIQLVIEDELYDEVREGCVIREITPAYTQEAVEPWTVEGLRCLANNLRDKLRDCESALRLSNEKLNAALARGFFDSTP